METETKTVGTEQPEEREEEEEALEERKGRSQSRSRSRSPLRYDDAKNLEDDDDDFSGSEATSIKDESISTNSSSSNKKQPIKAKATRQYKPILVLGNVPNAWTYKDVKSFIKGAVNSKNVADNVGFVSYQKIAGVSKDEACTSLIFFRSEEAAHEACACLNDMEVNGRRLTAHIAPPETKLRRLRNDKFAEFVLIQPGNKTGNNSPGSGRKSVLVEKKPNNSNDTYGLDLQFLNSLGVMPPLQSRITVFNVDTQVDKEKLKEIFGLAGHIVDIYRMRRNDGSAKTSVKIDYDHPVEAVQAISMFKYKKLFDKTLIIKMDNTMTPYKRPIPAGLSGIGPGLGENGEPLPFIRAHVELQSLKEQLKHQVAQQQHNPKQPNVPPSTLVPNASNANVPAVSLLNDLIKMCQWNTGQMNVGHTQSDPSANIPQQTQPFMEQNMNYFNAQVPGASLLSTPNMAAKVGNWQLQGNASNNQPKPKQAYPEPNQYINQYAQSTHNSNNESYKRNNARNFTDTTNADDDTYRNKCGDIIVFKNLPPSVTMEALKVKMSEVGELRGVELTGPGKALVRFVRERDAEKCLKLFDRSKVDGHVIIARYF